MTKQERSKTGKLLPSTTGNKSGVKRDNLPTKEGKTSPPAPKKKGK